MKKSFMRQSVGAGLILTTILGVSPAYAYNWKTHARVVEVAAQIMAPTFPNSTTAPSGVDQAQWTAYLAAINSAAVTLPMLNSGLGNAGKERGCGYRPEDNMTQIPNTRIQDLGYLPVQGGTVLNGSATQYGGPCSEVPIAPTCISTDNPLRLGRVLGVQAATPDNHTEDTNCWYKPTNAGGVSMAIKAASYAFNLGVAALVFPFLCLWSLFGGGDCDIHNAIDAGSRINPIDTLWGAIPGFGGGEDYNYVGFWHFVDVGAPFPGFYNGTRGMLYDNAGPSGIVGALDFGIMAYTDTVGLSIRAGRSAGVDRYGQFDQVHRSHAQWQAFSVGHTEFSALDELAQWGWTQFVANPTSAYGLAWPLHAFGDAAVPMHVAGTTGHGHVPFENETDALIDRQLLPPPANCSLRFMLDSDPGTLSPAQAARILRIGFDFWSKYRSQFAPNSVPVRAMVKDLAQQTYSLATGSQNGALFDDLASTVFHTNDATFCKDGGCQDRQVSDWVLDRYAAKANLIPPYLEMSSGAIIAFLAGAALTAKDPGANPLQKCPAGQIFDLPTQACVPGSGNPALPPAPDLLLPDPLAQGGSGGGGNDCQGLPTCQSGADCQSGICINGCCGSAPPK
jgi:hypothetical protein